MVVRTSGRHPTAGSSTRYTRISTEVLPLRQAECNLQYQLNGIRAGKLYAYTGSEKVYHCPNDKYWKTRNMAVDQLCRFRLDEQRRLYGKKWYEHYWISYGCSSVGSEKALVCVNKFNQIKSPGNRFTFVEEDYFGIHDQWRYAGGFVTMGATNIGIGGTGPPGITTAAVRWDLRMAMPKNMTGKTSERFRSVVMEMQVADGGISEISRTMKILYM